MKAIVKALAERIFNGCLFRSQSITCVCLTLLVSLITLKAHAADTTAPKINANKIWKNACFACHGESGDMARNRLIVKDGKLQGPLHKDRLRAFMTNHYLSESKAEAVYAMLLKKATTKSRFEQQCSRCHQSVMELVREKMLLHNGTLYQRESQTPVYVFLQTHQNLTEKDIRFFARQLTFIGYDVFQAVKMN